MDEASPPIEAVLTAMINQIGAVEEDTALVLDDLHAADEASRHPLSAAIEAVFHAHCGGHTSAAAEVWRSTWSGASLMVSPSPRMSALRRPKNKAAAPAATRWRAASRCRGSASARGSRAAPPGRPSR